MAKDWTQHSKLFLQLFADCIPVRGANRSAFYDLTRHEIILFPTEYYFLLEHILGKRMGDLLERIKLDPNKEQIMGFLDFLDEKELIMLVDDPSEFPPIENSWDFPGLVQNAVIDVSAVLHDFAKIFNELSALGCQYVQIRSFSNLLTLGHCHALMEHAQHKSIVGVELVLKHEDDVSDDTYITFVKQHSMVPLLTVHSAPQSKQVRVDTIAPVIYEGAPLRQIRFTSQIIDSETHCGIITQKHLTPPAVGSFFEAKSFNGCLNKKISVDAAGNIRNCPSMRDSYGNIRDSSLLQAVHAAGFKENWSISKDHISICRDCEFRYACSDCRAYLENPDDAFSKPLKCGYDPYSRTWNEWGENPAKRATAKLYGIELLVRRSKESLPAVSD
jgi:SPASM domain peptide maturase of grasp-with-spasm system